ncbi:MAG: Lrp/AsnC family transcriptional regulator [Candidatus Woesearchaeota archaeon]
MTNMDRSIFNSVKDSDMMILGELRKNSRQTLSEISKQTKISISTIYDRIKFHEEHLIKKHTSLLNFNMLGYSIRANILVSSNQKQKLKDYLVEHPNVNTAFEVNNSFDFIIDCIFSNMSDCRDFIDSFDKYGVSNIQVHYIVDEIKLESFMETKKMNGE